MTLELPENSETESLPKSPKFLQKLHIKSIWNYICEIRLLIPSSRAEYYLFLENLGYKALLVSLNSSLNFL